MLLALADDVPEVIARAIAESWRLAEGIDKHKLAGVLTATWYVTATAILDYLRDQCPAVPELDKLPEEVERLQKIARE